MRRPVVFLVALSAAASFAADGPELPARAFDAGQNARAETPRAVLSYETGGSDTTKGVDGAPQIARRAAAPDGKVKPPRAPEKGIPSVRPIEPQSVPGQSVAVTVRVVPETFATPAVFSLSQNQPNPAAGSTLIRYSLGIEAHVAIEVYSLQGARVATLVRGVRGAGQHTVQWNGLDDDGNAVRSGVYFYRMKSGSFRSTKKLILQR